MMSALRSMSGLQRYLLTVDVDIRSVERDYHIRFACVCRVGESFEIKLQRVSSDFGQWPILCDPLTVKIELRSVIRHNPDQQRRVRNLLRMRVIPTRRAGHFSGQRLRCGLARTLNDDLATLAFLDGLILSVDKK